MVNTSQHQTSGLCWNPHSICSPTAGARLRTAFGFGLFVFVSGCDFEVTNPGSMDDSSLDRPEAHSAVVTGAERAYALALNELIRTSAGLTRELTGRAGTWGIAPVAQQGNVEPGRNTEWNQLQRARWLSEDGERRFRRVLGDAEVGRYPLAAEILLWAGFANRTLGENMCDAVIDGGPVESYTVFFDRAVHAFSRAADIARQADQPDIEFAALAGRAAARIWLGDWTLAVQDAGVVPLDFVFEVAYSEVSLDLMNLMYTANRGAPHRAWTAWNTVQEAYFQQSGDPRVAWEVPEGEPVLDAPIIGGIVPPHYRQLKYDDPESPIRLATGREMRLLIAEAELREGRWEEAVGIINELRAATGVDPVSAAGSDEAWARLKRERGIELWLEGRRLGDLRRWNAESAPGALDPLETEGGQVPIVPDRDYCYPIPPSERDTNPNVP